jgi:hypothetical protein
MNKEFIPYQQAKELKELGFDEECLGWYPKDTAALSLHGVFIGKPSSGSYKLLVYAPTFSQAFHWLLDKHHLYGVVIPTVTMDWTFKTMTVAQGMVEVPPYNHVDACDYSSREEAELACLKKLIEIVKQKL